MTTVEARVRASGQLAQDPANVAYRAVLSGLSPNVALAAQGLAECANFVVSRTLIAV